MERSRSKRNYYYDQDYDTEPVGRTKHQRYNNHNNHHQTNSHRNRGGGGGSRPPKNQDTTVMVTTTYRILCHDLKAGGVIGKSGSIIKSIRQHTGAWVNVHELLPGDEERIIEISDTRRRDPDGRMPSFSPAQEALFLIHDRILETEGGFGMGYGADEDDDYGIRGSGNRVVTRIVVSRVHVGCLLGKGGKIIEQMRMETKTQIRVLPRDHTLPQCVTMSEEIVQVVGDMNNVKNAIAIISSRLKESQHRDRSNVPGRLHSPDQFMPPGDDFIPNMNTSTRRSPLEGGNFGSRASLISGKKNNYATHPSGFKRESGGALDNYQPFYEDIVFRILCPIDKVDKVVGESNGIMDLLQNEVGVDVKAADLVPGSNERIIIISSDEGPGDELFPAQEALLHIQTCIVDLIQDEDNFVTTRLLIPFSEIGCLEGRDGSDGPLSEIRRAYGANVQIVPREELPACVTENDELVQITGEIKAVRNALVDLTSILRVYLYWDFYQKDMPPPFISAGSSAVRALGLEAASNNIITAYEGHTGSDPRLSTYPNAKTVGSAVPTKDTGASGSVVLNQNDTTRREDMPRFPMPLVTRSTLEVVIPDHAASKLITKSKNKLTQISEFSGAKVTLVEDRPDTTEKIIQISGTPEQAERAQSLLQGFILSTEEDG